MGKSRRRHLRRLHPGASARSPLACRPALAPLQPPAQTPHPRKAGGAWNCVAFVNLSFLIPSSPGGIGPFEAAAQKSLATHGADPAAAALYGLALHVWMLVTITGIGGAWFLYPRYHQNLRKPLLTEIETLPDEFPG